MLFLKGEQHSPETKWHDSSAYVKQVTLYTTGPQQIKQIKLDKPVCIPCTNSR